MPTASFASISRATSPRGAPALEGLITQFIDLLEPRDYFLPPARAGSTRRTLRTILTKPGWNHLEVRTLRGVLTAMARDPNFRPPRRPSKAGNPEVVKPEEA